MYTIPRHIEPVIRRRAAQNKALLLTGARQTGKSTLFRHIFDQVNRVTLDDDLLLVQASEDPGLFLFNNPTPLMIDEVQKCPSLFNQMKIRLDDSDQKGLFFLTGSQKFTLMEGISESLSGRISISELGGLSLREIYRVDFDHHFIPTADYLYEREKQLTPFSRDIWQIIHRGSFPELYSEPEKDWADFYRSYVATYLERDVNRLIKASNHLDFVRFLTAAAARSGQILNYANLASEVGVSEPTIKEWISILERSDLIYLLKPFSSSVLNRAIKAPKLYFRDTGLCSYLTRWLTPDTLKTGAMAGAMFETFVIGEILKSYTNEGSNFDFSVFYYNGKDKNPGRDSEIDLIIQENGILYPIEIKMTMNPKTDMAAAFDVLDKVPEARRGPGTILCPYNRKMYLRENLLVLPLDYL